jgi:hypothetical protein
VPKPFDIRSYLALRGLLGPFACWILLIAALFGAHTPSAGYDNDDPNRAALVADFPRLALNGMTARRNSVTAEPQALDRPLERPLSKPAGSAAAVAAPFRWTPVGSSGPRPALAVDRPAPRRHPSRSPRGPPLQA